MFPFYEQILLFLQLVGKFLTHSRRNGLLVTLRKTSRFISQRFRHYQVLFSLLFYRTALPFFSKNNKHLVTYVIPVYDRVGVLRDCIESVLGQDYSNIELIIICDGSPKETLDLVKTYVPNPRVRVFYYPMPSGSASRGRNKGILEARGAYIAFLDSDDLAMADRTSKSLALLQTGYDVVYGSARAVVDGTRHIDGINNGEVMIPLDLVTLSELLDDKHPFLSTVTVKKQLFDKYGAFKQNLLYREDHELWCRLAYYGAKFGRVPAVLCDYRIHSGNNELNYKYNDNYWKNESYNNYRHIPKKRLKIAFILPGLGISGGIAVVLRHANMLVNADFDVMLINIGHELDAPWFPFLEAPIYNISSSLPYVFHNLDIIFATSWNTFEWLARFESKNKAYFVQSDERRFDGAENSFEYISSTYSSNVHYVTEARWIRKMLREEFKRDGTLIPNGIDYELFASSSPLEPRNHGKIRILLEGPIAIPSKGMIDAYNAVSGLPCEIWIVSSAGRPPANWKYDCFFEKVPMQCMGSIYSSCDIFVKMSRVEGFFGPPLEAMACGCAVVAGDVTGAREYMVNEYNSLIVGLGDVTAAREAVVRLINDHTLREYLINNGKFTAQSWTWEESHKSMLEFIMNIS